MNAEHTAFDANVTLNDSSGFISVGDADGVGVEYTVIRDATQLAAITTNPSYDGT